jgi:hypothetical protein
MRRRHRYLLNVAALALLGFALYLNFVRKESNDVNLSAVPEKNPTSSLSQDGLKGAVVNPSVSFSLK